MKVPKIPETDSTGAKVAEGAAGAKGAKGAKAPAESAGGGDQSAYGRSARKERNRVRRSYVIMILVSFVFAVAFIYRYSYVIETSEFIRQGKMTLTKYENENSLLQKQISLETDLEAVRLLAESKLGMQKPDKEQIVYIKVPRKDHALMSPPDKQQSADSLNPFIYLVEQARLVRKRLIAD